MIVKVLLFVCLFLFSGNVISGLNYMINENAKYKPSTCIITEHRIDEYNCSCRTQYSGYVTYTAPYYGNLEFETGRSVCKTYIENSLLKEYPLNSKVDCFILRNVSDVSNAKIVKFILDPKIPISLFIVTFLYLLLKIHYIEE